MPPRSEDQDCMRCGRCCTHIGNVHRIASPEEWERIIDHLLATREGRWRIRCRCSPRCGHSWEGEVRTLDDLPVFLLEDIYPCPFLARERDARGRFTGRTTCQVYPVRPAICRMYPFSELDAERYGCPAHYRAQRSRRPMPRRAPTRAPRTLAAPSRTDGSRAGTRS